MFFNREPQNIKNILILGHKNIGDIISDLVVIDPIKKKFPEAKIYFLTAPATKNLIEGYKGIDEILIIDKKNKDINWGDRFNFNKTLWKYDFDMILVLTRTWMYKYLYTRYVWNVRKTHDKHFFDKKMHPIDIFIDFLKLKGIEVDQPKFDFDFSSEQAFCDEFYKKHGIKENEKLVGFLPLAAWAFKNWPVEKWNELSEKLLSKHGIRMLAFGKAIEGSYTDRVIKELSSDIISAIDQTSLKQAAALIQRCKIFLGPDSSLLHLSSLLGVHSIGLYGPTPVDYVYPYYHKSDILIPSEREEGMLCQTDPINCPCKKPRQPARCMENLSVSQVLEAIEAKL